MVGEMANTSSRRERECWSEEWLQSVMRRELFFVRPWLARGRVESYVLRTA